MYPRMQSFQFCSWLRRELQQEKEEATCARTSLKEVGNHTVSHNAVRSYVVADNTRALLQQYAEHTN